MFPKEFRQRRDLQSPQLQHRVLVVLSRRMEPTDGQAQGARSSKRYRPRLPSGKRRFRKPLATRGRPENRAKLPPMRYRNQRQGLHFPLIRPRRCRQPNQLLGLGKTSRQRKAPRSPRATSSSAVKRGNQGPVSRTPCPILPRRRSSSIGTAIADWQSWALGAKRISRLMFQRFRCLIFALRSPLAGEAQGGPLRVLHSYHRSRRIPRQSGLRKRPPSSALGRSSQAPTRPLRKRNGSLSGSWKTTKISLFLSRSQSRWTSTALSSKNRGVSILRPRDRDPAWTRAARRNEHRAQTRS